MFEERIQCKFGVFIYREIIFEVGHEVKICYGFDVCLIYEIVKCRERIQDTRPEETKILWILKDLFALDVNLLGMSDS